MVFTTSKLVAKGVRSIRDGHLTDTRRTPWDQGVRHLSPVLVTKKRMTDTDGHFLQYSPHTRAHTRTRMTTMLQKVSVSIRHARIVPRNGSYIGKIMTDTYPQGIRHGLRQVSVAENAVAQ